MNSKRNQILLGIIILIFGLFTLVRPSIGGLVNFGSLITLTAGCAFLLLYRTKRKSWSLILGGYLTYLGMANLLSPIFGQQLKWSVVGAMFFIVPATIFLILYLDKNKRGLLLPSCLMLWFGVFLFVRSMSAAAHMSNSGILFVCIGIAFFMAYFMGKNFIGKWTVYIGGVFIVLGILRIFHANPFSVVFNNFSQFCAIALIFASICIIVKALRR